MNSGRSAVLQLSGHPSLLLDVKIVDGVDEVCGWDDGDVVGHCAGGEGELEGGEGNGDVEGWTMFQEVGGGWGWVFIRWGERV